MKSQFAKLFATLVLLGVVCQLAYCDIPVHCLYENVYGTWTFYKTQPNYDNTVIYNQCSINSPSLPTTKIETATIQLAEPNIAILMGKPTIRGHFTMIYDQGMEVKIDGLRYFAFFNYTQVNVNNNTIVTSHCDQTFVGTYHDSSIPAKKWGCFKGFKASSKGAKNVHTIDHAEEKIVNDFERTTVFANNDKYVQALNKAQSTWKATAHKQFEGMTFAELKRISGSSKRSYHKHQNLKKQKEKLRALNGDRVTIYNGKTGKFETHNAEKLRASLPTELDWTNINGRDFVVPVRNQEQCGSCYAFSSSDMFGSRVRVHTNLTKTPVYSPQDIVDCSAYSPGCDGGFPFLVGKYAQDYGLTIESCDPYQGHDLGKCSNTCPINRQERLYASNYYFVGGYYGASSELNMMHEIYQNGPLAIGFEVYPDLRNYKNGVYKHVTADELKAQGLSDEDLIPHFEVVNHAVLMVGWGVENGTPYWKIKNSWSTSWGDNGYFKILRGADNCGVESDAEAGIPFI